MQEKRVAIRELAQFIYRADSLDNRKQSNHTALDGAKIHRRLQKSAEGDYQAELALKITYQGKHWQILLEGRCDGVFVIDGTYCIDEIKTSAVHLEYLTAEELALFFAQAKLYAYIYAKEKQLTEIFVQIRYYQVTDETIEVLRELFQFADLEAFYLATLERYEQWLDLALELKQKRDGSIEQLSFPFPAFRQGQRELAGQVYRALTHEKQLFTEAPTGTGKTLSTLFPALKALQNQQINSIFYLTAKTVTRQVAMNSLALLQKNGLQARVVEINAKEKICFQEKCICNPDACPFAKNYFQKRSEALWELLNGETLYFDQTTIQAIAQKHQLCPFEFSLDLSQWCDVIVADYNYLFDPQVYLRRFFEGGTFDGYALVDESHNLIHRAREMYSTSLSVEWIERFYQYLPKSAKKHRSVIQRILDELTLLDSTRQKQQVNELFTTDFPESLVFKCYQWSEYFADYILEFNQQTDEEWILLLYFDLLHFLKIAEYFDDTYLFSIDDRRIHFYCLDPAWFLNDKMKQLKGTVLFSATFSPIDYYQQLLGGNEDSLTYRLPSPFAQEHLQILVADYIKMDYQNRQSSIPEICQLIIQTFEAKRGNYMVFFPSFRFMDEVIQALPIDQLPFDLFIQERQMTAEAKEEFLAAFQPNRAVVGFCVLGGMFSEGIDLKGEKLIGSIILSVGIPQINDQQEELKKYFIKKGLPGYDYTYRLPGLNKVLQAAGRVIRSEEDYGVVILVDHRFASQTYMRQFPSHWAHGRVCHHLAALKSELQQFWNKAYIHK
ncbi:ATP-dependent DNA helicase [Enterococcus columbae]|uniref:Helicase ATP-binding domain-containing protein n=1 Tax=Enterococcus columbae DSM 7374 = ATCC 51263 TaxID=1121865 RepID=S0KIC9_9ENTE|nr:ATP-dependent DNA helicase [Enterococcus columbae]EOT44599.1 hypothetical protein OMW_00655 [Enterococcus columbae DSM 7374 = ATCC 51263]EOW87505.1 hypothetical protein I568_00549 [Enterococcus columbae DSM 7374 = ATCC 51263]OJG25161.1 hypothetical protein RR47_GL001949 [Enterococcus columbae DSM 7374 = ATCC 51263]